MIKKVKKQCKICDKIFEVSNNRKKTAKWCSYKCSSKGNRGRNHSNYKDIMYRNGYIFIHQPNHSFTQKSKVVKRSRFIMEKYLGRHLNSKEIVHHINGIKNDDRIKNLKLLHNRNEHAEWHHPKGKKIGCK